MGAAAPARARLAGHGEHLAPCSTARAAVIKEPLFSVASTTTTPSDSPLIRRLRAEN